MLARPQPKSALRQRRMRERQRAGRAVLRIEIDLGTVSDWLCEKRFLQTWDSENPRAVAAALERAVTAWSRFES